jgi:hypothetical protein
MTEHTGYELLQDPVERHAGDACATGDLNFGDPGLQGLHRDGRDLIECGLLGVSCLGEFPAQVVELSAGLDVGCVGHAGSVSAWTSSVYYDTLRELEKQGSRCYQHPALYSRRVVR